MNHENPFLYPFAKTWRGRWVGQLCLLIACLLIAGLARAQTAGTIAFSVTPTSGNVSVSPTATWSTTPAATSCTASGGWSGTLAGSGTMALGTANKTTTYTITCKWAAVLGQATLTWTLPTTNTDGSPLTDLAGFHVFYGKSANSMTQEQIVGGATATTAVVADLDPATWYFAVASTNSKGVDGPWTPTVSKTISGTPAATASKSATVTVVPAPSPPGNLTVVEKTAYNIRADFRHFAFVRGDRWGTARIGAACDETRCVAGGYCVVASRRSLTPRPEEGEYKVARCAG